MTMVNTALVEMVDPNQAAGFTGSEVLGDHHRPFGRPVAAAVATELCGKRKRNRNWTHSEVLLLIEAKKSETDPNYDSASCVSRDKLVTSSEKWKRVVDHMKRNGIDDRDVAQCKGKWDNLLSDYKTIKGVLKKSGRSNYFSMSIEERRKEDPSLPCYFDKDLFERLDSFLSGRVGLMPCAAAAAAAGGGGGGGSGGGFTDISTSAQSTHVKSDRVLGQETDQLGGSSAGKKKKQSGSDVVAAISRLTSSYMAAVTSMEEKREARHREMLQFEREKLQTESRDRRELTAQLGNLALAFNRVADNLKDI